MKLNSYTWRGGVIKSDLPSTTRHVLLTLSCHFNDAGEACYPSTRLLAEETGLSERAVITHLIRARELGWLIVSKHGFAGQRWSRNQYVPSFPEGTEARSVPSGKGAEPDAKKALNDVQSNYSSVELLITTTTTAPQAQDCSSGLTQILHWPACLPEDTRHLLLQGLVQLPGNVQQQILDVVAAAHSAGTIKRTAEALAAAIIRRALRGGKDGFDPTPGLGIARRRVTAQAERKKQAHAETSATSRTTPEVAGQHCKGIKALIKSRGSQNQNL